MQRATLSSLNSLTHDEAKNYLSAASGDELGAAFSLACDRNLMAGSDEAPDDTEVHHALFLIRRALGGEAPSFDSVRKLLRSRAA